MSSCDALVARLVEECEKYGLEGVAGGDPLGLFEALMRHLDGNRAFILGIKDVTIDVLTNQNERMRAALCALERWDMLTLSADGHGAATADAPWARDLIADALAFHADDRKAS